MRRDAEAIVHARCSQEATEPLMFQEGRLVELTIPGTERLHRPAPPTDDFDPDPCTLVRTDQWTLLPVQTPAAFRDTRPPW
ncbi:hypothetical protein ACFCXK_08600 [Streptomyces sp. NPDC056269]|uniref:hypothetical protein n=1 Tax=Streptomyces sp. NPDC056269 TaxID=3345768 RepID=UPI0035DE8758